MDIRILGCYGGELDGRHASGFLINRTVLLEGGAVTSVLALADQLPITHVLVSHAHLDHTKELIYLVDNLFLSGVRRVRLLGIPPVVATLREHLFNDQLWPDFTRIPASGRPVLSFGELVTGARNEVGGLEVVPVPVNHTVPCSGFLIGDGASQVLYTGDTGPTDELWRVGRAAEGLRAVFAECSFPDDRRELALESGHLTPALLAVELEKLGRPEVPVYVTHLKPAFAERIAAELERIIGRRIILLEQGTSLAF